ncbi:Vacuolar protein sorting-associated protein 52 [Komagataella phaffii CBS 7435]|uniref:Component of the GARP (Golgi-associated retrograde protein) complex n=2 Tax=Komagataella phaffii TaxID=460519 RepID=C4QV13_KOMPG|nr:Component of the GARP (Golgi-associated retrograde protein) complex [Komagataella phaffii GS115]AOA61280.1 GQ67_02281T0 [Komagataella phaffii]CAH2445736.1 Vacuolar protein sorting-associated protein 52 [Komagataella phaffii CBS 7435]AOA66680.1 GQ68_02966T0 [Komagataella phaffii GS115]CAY67083.1 Component of the GARP (Golgi-associated retrograde protein) complex [Komagataella phaffii GS115]CCA36196.1 Vacuolar protein sorting-associated protein 52 [Komagataella phaffii CBS 7435]
MRQKQRISRRSISRHQQFQDQDNTNKLELLKQVLNVRQEEETELNEQNGYQSDYTLSDFSVQDVYSLQELRFLTTQFSEQCKDFSMRTWKHEMAAQEDYSNILVNTKASLEPLIRYLNNFEVQLKELSLQMEFLQERSNELNQQIEQKNKINRKLAPIVNDLVIPPKVILSVLNDNIDASWTKNIIFIKEKQQLLSKYTEQDELQIKCSPMVVKVLELLKLTVVERSRDFIINQIKLLRKPNCSSQVIQKQLLDCKLIYSFLKENSPELATQLRKAYAYTMRWYYHQNFSKYLYSLERLEYRTVPRDVLLGETVDSQLHVNEYLNLGTRAELINSHSTLMPAQIAETNQLSYYIETGFNNFNGALLDNVSTEYLFLSQFFELYKFDEVNDLFKLIFQPTFTIGINYTKNLIRGTFDIYGVLLCIRLSQLYDYELQHRKIPVMDDYINLQLINLWPHFQIIIDENCESLKKAVPKLAVQLHKTKNTLIPLVLTQQFGQLIAGLLKLTTHKVFETEQTEPLTVGVSRLSNEFEAALTKLSSSFKDSNQKELFFYNNFYLVLTMLSDDGKFAHDIVNHFEKLLQAYKS